MDKQTKRSIVNIAIIYIGIFILIISYLSYFVIVKSKDIVIHTNNRRLDPLENEVIRGDILSSDGEIIATTIEGDTPSRDYPMGRKYAHVAGYTQQGKTGMEAFANVELLRANYNVEGIFKKAFYGEKFIGRDVVLTVDSKLQEVAREALGDQKGAIILMEPSTGKIKALVSKPDFDPNNVAANWDTLISDNDNSRLLNRAVSGLYPPGSIFKIVTSQAFFDAKGVSSDVEYECTGQITVDNYTIRCFKQTAHGKIKLAEAFKESCNTYFINMGMQLDTKEFQKTGNLLLFNENLPVAIEHSKSQLLTSKDASPSELAATYMGQGKTLVTPIHMVMIASAIANEGILMEPYILDYSKDRKGNVKTKNIPHYVTQLFEAQDAKKLKEMMLEVVSSGTGTRVAVSGMNTGGKTGTAQNETDKDHSWFIGFTGNDDIPQLAMAIIVENGGEGAKASVIAGKIVKAYKDYK